ncbi:MAG: serine/threonine-protein kinase [Blastocatellia bacterium]
MTPLTSNFPLSDEITRDYRILSKLGEGGMGEVYLAEQLRVGRRQVALKVLNPEYSANPTVIKRFENEAASAGLINHRNVVMIYESRITADGQMYVAMEYVRGQSLREMLDRAGALPVSQAVEIARQCCAGLAAAHKLGIVHRDIKPDNIMVTTEEGAMLVKVVDFGIARLAEPGHDAHHTRAGTVIGTPEYMSPEQASGATGDRIDLRSDIYSLGMVVYEMLTGSVAFRAGEFDSYLTILNRQVNEMPMRPSLRRPEVNIPAAVEQVVLKALSKDRNDRQQSAQALASELLAARQQADSFRTSKSRSLQTIAETGRATINGREVVIPAQADSTEIIMPVIPPPVYPDAPEPPPSVIAQPQENQPAPVIEESPVVAKRKAKWKIPVAAATAGLLLLIALVVILKNRPPADQPEPEQKSGALQNVTPSPVASESSVKAAPVRLLDYSIRTKTNEILPTDNTVHSDSRICFDFELPQSGAVYLFSVTPNQGLVWLDATPGKSRPFSPQGRIFRLPASENAWWVIDRNPGLEKFLVVLVPADLTWSLEQTIDPEKIKTVAPDVAELSPAAARRLFDFLKQNAVEMSPATSQNGNETRHTLQIASPEKRIAYYEITLNHVP